MLPTGEPSQIASILEQIASGKLDPGPLVAEYSDLHGFHGGLKLTIHGTGDVQQQAVRERVGTPKKVSRDDLLRLVRLLLAQQVWEQRVVREGLPVPDESLAYVTVLYKEERAGIWEWYNTLHRNQRIVVIRELMKEIAWEK